MSIRSSRHVIAMLLTAVLVVTAWSLPAGAAPSREVAPRLAQNVDWLSPDDARSLALDFTVMVPSWLPEPFGGTPAIQAGGGYYSLYWMIPGGPPTFLHITGEVGAALPAGSPADLNNQLFVNASVQGYDAIHDVTAIYDNVWWVAGGVLYTVSSKNMAGSDSLSLANSLVALEQPAPAPEPTPTPVPAEPTPAPSPTGVIDNPGSVTGGDTIRMWVEPSGLSTLRATDGVFEASGAAFLTDLTATEVTWRAPSVSAETTIEFTLVDAETGIVTDWSAIVVYPAQTSGGSNESSSGNGSVPTAAPQSTSVPASASNGDGSASAPIAAPTTAPTSVPASAGQGDGSGGSTAQATSVEPTAVQTPTSAASTGGLLSDGTAGPAIPRGGDGTGGIGDLAVP